MKIAVAKYPIERVGDVADFAIKQRRWLQAASNAGARVAVLPEYLSLELAAMFPEAVRADLPASLAALQTHRGSWCRLFEDLARDTGMHIVAGSFLLATGDGRYRNRADLFSPNGCHRWQDKLQLTGFEKRLGIIDGGDALKVFDIDGVRMGIAICYDIEFPLPVRAQCEAGAQVLLVPSCTDTAAGATRVRIGAMARALENRCFVAQAVTAGEAPWNPALDVNTGEATLYAPMDVGFPADGIVAATGRRAASDDVDWAIADVDVAALVDARAQAQVANDRDWSGQLAPALLRAKLDAAPHS